MQLKQDHDHDNVLKNFAGININAEMKVDAMNMSMKQFLIAQDKINFQKNQIILNEILAKKELERLAKEEFAKSEVKPEPTKEATP